MSSNDVQIIIEHFDDKFDSLLEAMQLMNSHMSTLAKDSDLQEVKAKVNTIELAVTATNRDLHTLEGKVDKLEGKVDRLGVKF